MRELLGGVLFLLSACSHLQASPMSNDSSNTPALVNASKISGLASSIQPEVVFNLSDQQWQHRVLLVFAPSEQSLVYQQQQQAWKSRTEAIKERDLKLVEILADAASRVDGHPMSATSADRLRNQFRVAPEAFVVILIGKDGTEKQRFSQPVDLSAVFNTIDAMPMRQQEML